MNDSASNTTSLADRIDAVLPQTQCTRCDYPACREYAQAIARGDADINQCPPGGAAGIQTLANLLGRAAKALNPANGVETSPQVAIIDESVCIGCTKCIQACPVDAIIGTNKMMHTILADECNGCELCIPACPVDCIAMQPVAAFADDAPHFKQRYGARRARLAALARRTQRPTQRTQGGGRCRNGWQRYGASRHCARASKESREQKSTAMNATKRTEIFRRLREVNPRPTTELQYATPFQLLIAVMFRRKPPMLV